MKSLSNLLKSNNIVCNEIGKRIIDYNELISAKLIQIKTTLEHEAMEANADNFVEGIQADKVELLIEERQNEASLQADEILRNAQAEANAILEVARKQAEQLKAEAKQAGLIEGRTAGSQETANKLKELNKLKVQLEEDYDKKVSEMEPVLVDAILTVCSKVTKVLANDKKDMIIHLVNSVMSKAGLSKDYQIKVSKEDYKFLLDNKDKIYGVAGREANIDIYEDAALQRNQCLIEADNGVFDCSLDIQLENLISSIKVLSCMTE